MSGKQHPVYLKPMHEEFREKHIDNLSQYIQQAIHKDIMKDPAAIQGAISYHEKEIAKLNLRLEVAMKKEEVKAKNGGMDADQQAIHDWLVQGLGEREGQTAMNWLTGPDQEERLKRLGMSPERFLKEMVEHD